MVRGANTTVGLRNKRRVDAVAPTLFAEEIRHVQVCVVLYLRNLTFFFDRFSQQGTIEPSPKDIVILTMGIGSPMVCDLISFLSKELCVFYPRALGMSWIKIISHH